MRTIRANAKCGCRLDGEILANGGAAHGAPVAVARRDLVCCDRASISRFTRSASELKARIEGIEGTDIAKTFVAGSE